MQRQIRVPCFHLELHSMPSDHLSVQQWQITLRQWLVLNQFTWPLAQGHQGVLDITICASVISGLSVLDSTIPGSDIGTLKFCRIHTRRAFGTTFETFVFSEWPHRLKRGFITTDWAQEKAVIEEDLAEREAILNDVWVKEERGF